MRTLTTAALALSALLAAPVSAGTPASKHAVAYGAPAVIGEGGWQPILGQKIKTANDKGLAVSVSLECGLYTKTVVKTKAVTKAEAKASVKVRVLVDGEEADPGPVTFCSRSSKTSAALSDIFTKPENESCFLVDGNDEIVKIDPTCLVHEELELLEDSMSAHSYFFYYDSATPGEHTVTVEALIDETTGAEGEDTLASDQGAKATLGNGSVLIEEIRLTHGASGETLEF
jgi:hypothetical protein